MNGKKLVIVEWLDHSEGKEWTAIGDLSTRPLHVFTVGWVIEETDDVMIVAPNYTVEEELPRMITGDMMILKRVIVSIQTVTGFTKRKRKR